jgi:hypothetical protein
VDFLPGLVAPRVGVFVTELGQQTHCVLYFPVIYFSCFYFGLLRDVGTLNGTLQTLKHLTEQIKTSALEFQDLMASTPANIHTCY